MAPPPPAPVVVTPHKRGKELQTMVPPVLALSFSTLFGQMRKPRPGPERAGLWQHAHHGQSPGANPHDQLRQARAWGRGGRGRCPRREDSPNQMTCFHLHGAGVVLPGLLIGDRELRKTRVQPTSRKGGRGQGLVPGEMLGEGPGAGVGQAQAEALDRGYREG